MALPVQPTPSPEPLLELERVDAGYAAFRALFAVSFGVPEGSALALLGSNGSGKTSVARVISGLMLQESNMDQDVESAAQARGLSQLIASTAYDAARALGVYGFHSSDLFHPKKTGSLHLGGIVRRAAHPKQPKRPLNGGPQMVEISRDGRRAYFTNSLYSPWDVQFYPEGIRSWMVKVDTNPQGGMQIDPHFLVDFGDLRGHQVRLEGGDASSDSYCYA